jgi:uncharacterized protein (TIGR02118 family)
VEDAMIAITHAYRSGVKMDTDYYAGFHVPFIENSLSKWGLRGTETRKIVGTPTGDPAPYQAITTLYFDNMPTYSTAMSSDNGRAVLNDIHKFYDGMPEIMIGEV